MPIPRKLFFVHELPVLRALLHDADLKFIDVGGRGSAFHPLLTLARFAHYFVSEPDAPEAAALAERLPREAVWRAVTVMTEAVAGRHGTANLYLTAQPGMSSLLEPNPTVIGRFVLGSKFAVVKRAGFLGDLISWEDGVYGTSESVFAGGA